MEGQRRGKGGGHGGKGGRQRYLSLGAASNTPANPPTSTYQTSLKAVADVGAYPGYSGSLSVLATVAVQNNDDDSGIVIEGTIVGLEASVTGGIHIHSGVSCASASYVGGHYYDTDWALSLIHI